MFNTKVFTVRFLLLIFGLTTALVVCEGAIRLLHVAPEVAFIEQWRMRLSRNPKIGYEPIPHLDSTNKSVQFYGYRGASNSLGFRDQERRIERSAGVERILVLGDSITAGLWIENDRDTFPAQLETLLSEYGQIEVLNFGVSGYNTQQEVETLREKGLEFKPDIVIVSYCLNDRWQDDGGIYWQLLKAQENSAAVNISSLSPYTASSALFRWLRYRALPAWGYFKPTQTSRDAAIFNRDTVDESLAELAELRNRYNFPVLLVVFPDFQFIDKHLPTYNFHSEHTQMRFVAEKFGFEHLDLLSPMLQCKENSPEELLSFDRFHPRPIGNRCAAQAIAKKLLSLRGGLQDSR